MKSTTKPLALLLFVPLLTWGNDYVDHEKGQAFIAELAGQYGYQRDTLVALFEQVERDDVILEKISRPAEKTTPWYRYREIFMDQPRIDNGVAFYQANQSVLHEAYEKFGVSPEIIVAILGVETRYGKVMGNDSVIRALATIAFDYPAREPFFTKELRAFLEMAAQEQFDPLVPKGSYAGAMGMAQFMPSSYLHYAVDYEGDGKRDLWNNPNDAIFSIANYLAEHGWQRDQLIFDNANLLSPYAGEYQHRPFTTLGELKAQGVLLQSSVATDDTPVGMLQLDGASGPLTFVTFTNFGVITRYNTSPMYAMVVTELANAIANSIPNSVSGTISN
ncbi:lytic murein transglycosylase B [Ostreibacterium oceani]|uniref:Lytic murein transglycosylase B n=1 Tax=Ostreibacterium oceani TaxID=2654998 RepID=A0A6N7EYF9_9GAMM|nr:lytic murein transglycosylase B [Ostreibacterium oceani]MPV86419.1 lytic murein transglycosylase B [Ostreibacterium oceani]